MVHQIRNFKWAWSGCQWTMSSLAWLMACRLFGAKPLPEPKPPYHELDPEKHDSAEFESNYKILAQENAFINDVCKMAAILFRAQCGSLLWPVWWSGSTLAQVMACCLAAPSHNLNQCWLIIKVVLFHSLEGSFTGHAHYIYPWHFFEDY